VPAKTAFVIMPFSSTSTTTEQEWTEIYDHVFKGAFEGAGYECERAAPMTGSLLDSILDKLHRSEVVVADITDRNANVFYELGIRHCFRSGTIIVAQSGTQLPSDLHGLWYTQYGTRPAEVARFKEEIKRLLAAIEERGTRGDNPVSDYLEREQRSVSRFLQKDNLKKLGALVTELDGNRMVLNNRGSNREFLSYGCLDLLINTMYIDPGPGILSQAYELRVLLRRFEFGERTDGLLISATQRCEFLFGSILDLRNSIQLGKYAEPEQISFMGWNFVGDKANDAPPSAGGAPELDSSASAK
jgi:hypothetical protein